MFNIPTVRKAIARFASGLVLLVVTTTVQAFLISYITVPQPPPPASATSYLHLFTIRYEPGDPLFSDIHVTLPRRLQFVEYQGASNFGECVELGECPRIDPGPGDMGTLVIQMIAGFSFPPPIFAFTIETLGDFSPGALSTFLTYT